VISPPRCAPRRRHRPRGGLALGPPPQGKPLSLTPQKGAPGRRKELRQERMQERRWPVRRSGTGQAHLAGLQFAPPRCSMARRRRTARRLRPASGGKHRRPFQVTVDGQGLDGAAAARRQQQARRQQLGASPATARRGWRPFRPRVGPGLSERGRPIAPANPRVRRDRDRGRRRAARRRAARRASRRGRKIPTRASARASWRRTRSRRRRSTPRRGGGWPAGVRQGEGSRPPALGDGCRSDS